MTNHRSRTRAHDEQETPIHTCSRRQLWEKERGGGEEGWKREARVLRVVRVACVTKSVCRVCVLCVC